jgi:hypothetical protein
MKRILIVAVVIVAVNAVGMVGCGRQETWKEKLDRNLAAIKTDEYTVCEARGVDVVCHRKPPVVIEQSSTGGCGANIVADGEEVHVDCGEPCPEHTGSVTVSGDNNAVATSGCGDTITINGKRVKGK